MAPKKCRCVGDSLFNFTGFGIEPWTCTGSDVKTNSPTKIFLSDIDECLSNPCTNARCVNEPGRYRCVCEEGSQIDVSGHICYGECEKSSHFYHRRFLRAYLYNRMCFRFDVLIKLRSTRTKFLLSYIAYLTTPVAGFEDA